MEAIAVPLHLERPLLADRRLLGRRGKAGLDAGRNRVGEEGRLARGSGLGTTQLRVVLQDGAGAGLRTIGGRLCHAADLGR